MSMLHSTKQILVINKKIHSSIPPILWKKEKNLCKCKDISFNSQIFWEKNDELPLFFLFTMFQTGKKAVRLLWKWHFGRMKQQVSWWVWKSHFCARSTRALFPECDGVVQNSTTALCYMYKAVVFGWAEPFVVFYFTRTTRYLLVLQNCCGLLILRIYCPLASCVSE